jgi:uncharacterized protein (TIGR03083 family)
MSDSSQNRDKAEQLERMDEAWLRLNGFIESLTPAQLTGPTDAAGWTVKDHLAHLTAWERGMVFLLQRRPRHEGMGVEESVYLADDLDGLNEAIRQLTVDSPIDEVIADLRGTHEQLRAMIVAMPDEDLRRTYSWFLPDEPGADDGRPIISRIVGNSDGHFDEHMPWMQAIVQG